MPIPMQNDEWLRRMAGGLTEVPPHTAAQMERVLKCYHSAGFTGPLPAGVCAILLVMNNEDPFKDMETELPLPEPVGEWKSGKRILVKDDNDIKRPATFVRKGPMGILEVQMDGTRRVAEVSRLDCEEMPDDYTEVDWSTVEKGMPILVQTDDGVKEARFGRLRKDNRIQVVLEEDDAPFRLAMPKDVILELPTVK